MPNWNEILDEIQKEGSTYDIVRRKYLRNLQNVTGRNVIVYYSGWLQKLGITGAGINDFDKILTINPDDALAYLNRGNAYLYKIDIFQSLVDFNKAIKIDSGFAEAYYMRGLAYSKVKDYLD